MSTNKLKVCLFGCFEVLRGDQVLDLSARGSDKLLAFLLLQGKPVDQDTVAAALWPGTTPETLYRALRSLRSSLGADENIVKQVGQSLAVEAAKIDSDLCEFRKAKGSQSVALIQSALDQSELGLLLNWKAEWVHEGRRVVDEERAKLFGELGASYSSQGRFPEAAEAFGRYRDLCPSTERAWADRIDALIKSGERLLAREEIEQYRALLRKHGLTPTPRMWELIRLSGEEPTLTGHEGQFVAGGAVPVSSPYYVERDVDRQLIREMRQLPGIIYVKGSRQSGRSSLLARAVQMADLQDLTVLFLNFSLLGDADIADASRLSRWIIESLAVQVVGRVDAEILAEALSEQSMATPSQRVGEFLHDGVLIPAKISVFLVMDGMERLFDSPYRDDFFKMFRGWYEDRVRLPSQSWGRLIQLISCSTEPHLYLDQYNSPFNVRPPIEVFDFTVDEAKQLIQRYAPGLIAPEEIDSFLDLVGGHPYLLARGLTALKLEDWSLPEMLKKSASPDGPFANHLRYLLPPIKAEIALRNGLSQVLKKLPCSENTFFRLRSGGILVGSADCHDFRCGLYREWFSGISDL